MKKDESDPSDIMMSTKKAEKKVSAPKATPSSYPEMKPAASVKKADFKATIDKVQKALDRINKMEPIAKAKLTGELTGKLGPLLGEKIEPDAEKITLPEKFSDVEMSPVSMAKTWDQSIDMVKADMATWMPSLEKGSQQKGWQHEKDYSEGVHRETGGGKSWAGDHSRKGNQSKAKEIHSAKLSEMKAQPKPKLP